MIRPEGHQPLDERPVGGHARVERLPLFRGRDLLEATPRLAAFCVVPLRQLTKAAHGIGDGLGVGAGRRRQAGRVAAQLRAKPPARVREAAGLPHPGAQAESIEGSKGSVHTSGLTAARPQWLPCRPGRSKLGSRSRKP